MTTTELHTLLQQFLADELSEPELKKLLETAGDAAYRELWQTAVEDVWNNENLHQLSDDTAKQRVLQNLWKEEDTARRPAAVAASLRRHSFKWAVAAAILLLLAAGGWLLINRQPGNRQTAQQIVTDKAPGKNGAVLTLADGSKLVLDDLASGEVAEQQGAVVRLQKQQLVYDAAVAGKGPVVYNTLSTPAGRQFQLLLPDGSKVWLNAASSIRFPTAFTGNDRSVTVNGEVYMEIAADKTKPFYVHTAGAEVQVLGTSFNISAYVNDDLETTTLVNGAIKVSGKQPAAAPAILQPGNQVRISKEMLSVRPANIEQVLAWKNGAFNFEGLDLKAVMKEVARWYDVEVVYKGSISQEVFGGAMDRGLTLVQLLKALHDWHIEYTLEGRVLTIIGKTR